MLAIKISKADYEKLVKPIQAEYKLDGEDATLEVSGLDDGKELKTAKANEVREHNLTKKKVTELTEQLDAMTEERDGMLKGTIPKDDAAKLEKSWKDKFTAKEKELNDALTASNSQLQTMLVDNEALKIAQEISTAPAVILPHIMKRLKAELVDGKYITRVVDADGKPTASNLEDLKKDFIANKAFAPILTASKASGGGAKGGGGGGGAGTGQVDFKGSPADTVASLKASGKLVER